MVHCMCWNRDRHGDNHRLGHYRHWRRHHDPPLWDARTGWGTRAFRVVARRLRLDRSMGFLGFRGLFREDAMTGLFLLLVLLVTPAWGERVRDCGAFPCCTWDEKAKGDSQEWHEYSQEWSNIPSCSDARHRAC